MSIKSLKMQTYGQHVGKALNVEGSTILLSRNKLNPQIAECVT